MILIWAFVQISLVRKFAVEVICLSILVHAVTCLRNINKRILKILFTVPGLNYSYRTSSHKEGEQSLNFKGDVLR